MNFSPGSMSQESMARPSPFNLNCRNIAIALIGSGKNCIGRQGGDGRLCLCVLNASWQELREFFREIRVEPLNRSVSPL